MTFIKPSTSTALTTPYKFKGTMPSAAQNYIDLNFPNCLDALNGGSYTPVSPIILNGTGAGSTVLTILDGYVTINSNSAISMLGAVTLGAFTTWNVPNGINFSSTNGSVNIGFFDSSVNSGAGSSIYINGQNDTGTSSRGGSVNLNAGSGTSFNGTINLNVNAIAQLTVDNVDGFTPTTTWITGSSITIPNGSFNVTGTSFIEVSSGTFTTFNGNVALVGPSQVSSNMSLSGPGQFVRKVRIVTGSSYTVDTTGNQLDEVICVNNTSSSGNPFAVTLPVGSTCAVGRVVTVCDYSGNSEASGNNISIITQGTDHIGPNSSTTIGSNSIAHAFGSMSAVYVGSGRWCPIYSSGIVTSV